MRTPTSFPKKLLRSALPFPPKLDLHTSPADYVFVTQYYKNGGAERVINNYISALRSLHPHIKIAIIATDYDDGATWNEGVPPATQFINLAPHVEHLSRRLRVRLLGQILPRLSPQMLHIVNSKVALDFIASQKHSTPTYLSLFNSDFSASGRLRTYYKELKPAAEKLTRIFTDNAAVIAEATQATGLPKSLFRVHYQPITAQVQPPHTLPSTGKIRILWASRLTQQKRPDILRKIAAKLPEQDFSISVYGASSPPFGVDYFKDVPIIDYRGPYKSFTALPTKDFNLFLYTSQADGLPNILLEATAAGLPIITPNVGGISEFISDSTGFLVPDFTDTDSYASILTPLAKDRPDLTPKIKSAQSLLSSRHSPTAFRDTVAEDIRLPSHQA